MEKHRAKAVASANPILGTHMKKGEYPSIGAQSQQVRVLGKSRSLERRKHLVNRFTFFKRVLRTQNRMAEMSGIELFTSCMPCRILFS